MGIATIALLATACGTTAHADARKLAPTTTTTTKLAATTTTSTTTTLPPTTTTTVPPTTTTTIATGTVPDAVDAGRECGCSLGAEQSLTQAGFVVAVVLVTAASCYIPISSAIGQPEWNAGEVIRQSPSFGTVARIGTTVELDICGPDPSQ